MTPKKKRTRERRKVGRAVQDDFEEHFEFKPNISELLKQESGCSDTVGGGKESDNDNDDDDDEEEEEEDDEDTAEPDFNDYLDQSDDDEDDEERDESSDTASKTKDTGSDEPKLDKKGKVEEKDVVKYEEDEVKMEPESESEDGEEFEAKNSHSDTSTSASQLKKSLSDEECGSEKEKGELGKKPKYIYKGENPPCEICGKMFSRPSDLIKHMVSHTGAREFKCDICQDCFPLLNSLTR